MYHTFKLYNNDWRYVHRGFLCAFVIYLSAERTLFGPKGAVIIDLGGENEKEKQQSIAPQASGKCVLE